MMTPQSEGLYGRRPNPLVTVPLVLVLTICAGATGYLLLSGWQHEPWNFFDCIYFTVISLTTVGYGETLPGFAQNGPARAYTILVLILGYSVIVWASSSIVALFVEGRFNDLLGRRRMQREIAELHGHYILISLGETGFHALEEMRRTKREVVVIERDHERLAQAARTGRFLFIEGDADEEETLVAAGIGRARGLIACLPDDKDNIYVVLSARQLNPGLRIIARSTSHESRDKLLRAGADGVVSPTYIGGLRMASEMIRPHVTNFLDLMLRDKDQTIRIEEAVVGETSKLVGQTLREANIQQETGLLVIAVREPGKDGFVYNPTPDTLLEPGLALVVLGNVEDAKRLREMVES